MSSVSVRYETGNSHSPNVNTSVCIQIMPSGAELCSY